MKQLFSTLILIVISSTIGVNDMQAQEINDESDCGCYFDSIINKWIYVSYDIPPYPTAKFYLTKCQQEKNMIPPTQYTYSRNTQLLIHQE